MISTYGSGVKNAISDLPVHTAQLNMDGQKLPVGSGAALVCMTSVG